MSFPGSRQLAFFHRLQQRRLRRRSISHRRQLGDKLAARPKGLYRMKGFVLTSGGAYALHIVGQNVEAKRCEARKTQLVALGPRDQISRAEIDDWWGS